MKERIIGAVVLVLFVVLVVPVFLDGRSDSAGIISQRVPLPGQSEQKSQTVVLRRDREEPVPVTSANRDTESPQQAVARQAPPPEPKVANPATDEAQVVHEPAADKPARRVAQPATASATGMWAVQLGSFGNQENAEHLAADLRKQGFAAFLSEHSSGGVRQHRVRIGPQKDREAAEAMAERLARAGHIGQVVPHP